MHSSSFIFMPPLLPVSYFLMILIMLGKKYKLWSNVKRVVCHHGIARPQVADGEDGLQIWRVAANILNKQSRTANNGWWSSLGVGRGFNNSSL
jgi:hypothetical protein